MDPDTEIGGVVSALSPVCNSDVVWMAVVAGWSAIAVVAGTATAGNAAGDEDEGPVDAGATTDVGGAADVGGVTGAGRPTDNADSPTDVDVDWRVSAGVVAGGVAYCVVAAVNGAAVNGVAGVGEEAGGTVGVVARDLVCPAGPLSAGNRPVAGVSGGGLLAGSVAGPTRFCGDKCGNPCWTADSLLSNRRRTVESTGGFEAPAIVDAGGVGNEGGGNAVAAVPRGGAATCGAVRGAGFGGWPGPEGWAATVVLRVRGAGWVGVWVSRGAFPGGVVERTGASFPAGGDGRNHARRSTPAVIAEAGAKPGPPRATRLAACTAPKSPGAGCRDPASTPFGASAAANGLTPVTHRLRIAGQVAGSSGYAAGCLRIDCSPGRAPALFHNDAEKPD